MAAACRPLRPTPHEHLLVRSFDFRLPGRPRVPSRHIGKLVLFNPLLLEFIHQVLVPAGRSTECLVLWVLGRLVWTHHFSFIPQVRKPYPFGSRFNPSYRSPAAEAMEKMERSPDTSNRRTTPAGGFSINKLPPACSRRLCAVIKIERPVEST